MLARREWCASAAGFIGAAAFSPIGSAVAAASVPAQPARFWHREGNVVACDLCPHRCMLPDGKTGRCRNRQHRSGTLYTLGYGRPCALHVDPVEKKPFYHVLPGAKLYSIGVAGCNLRCLNCQNFDISQRSPLETADIGLSPEQAVAAALRENCAGIAFTYGEPTVWIEYVIDTAVLARRAGLATVVVSSGYINAGPFGELAAVLDAIKIDLKSFSDDTYRRLNAGKLQPVLDTLLLAKNKGVWLEVVNLVIPGWNDEAAQLRTLCAWVKNNLGVETPLHFSRFHPMYQLSNGLPTPVSTLKTAAAIAAAEGLLYVYIGNVAGIGGTTRCPSCGRMVVDRSGYTVSVNELRNGACGFCGRTIPGIWKQ